MKKHTFLLILPILFFISCLGSRMIKVEKEGVPNVLGLVQEQAASVITAADLIVGIITREFNDTIPKDHVISQAPEAETVVGEGTPIDLVVSLGSLIVAVPNVTGLPKEQAIDSLNRLELLIGNILEQNHEEIPAGHVIQVIPAPGTEVPRGTRIDLVASLGPAPFPIPNLVGLVAQEALDSIQAIGMIPGPVTTQSSLNVPAGIVIDQIPPAGELALPGDTLYLIVSSGIEWNIIPDVTGMSEEEAINLLLLEGFKADSISRQHHDEVSGGMVIGQNPGGSLSAPLGIDVNLIVSSGPEIVTVPDLHGWLSSEVNRAILQAGLVPGNVTFHHHEEVLKNRIISQAPLAGAEVVKGTSIHLQASLGPSHVLVPQVENHLLEEAIVQLSQSGLQVDTIIREFHRDVDRGYILRQEPPGGEIVESDTSVALFVSLGASPLLVPPVTGLLEEEAVNALDQAGLTIDTITHEPYGSISTGRVFYQYPEGGFYVRPDRRVILRVSTGPRLTEVPDVRGMAYGEAVRTLEENNFYRRNSASHYDDEMEEHLVAQQFPAPGEMAAEGSPVDLIFSLGPEQPGLDPSAGLILASDQEELDHYGHMVSAIGDVNGDGYEDFLASDYKLGRVYLYYGTSNRIDTTPGWKAYFGEDSHNNDLFASSAGDLNGDGFGDFFISEPEYDGDGWDVGRVMVFYGKESGPSASSLEDGVPLASEQDADWLMMGPGNHSNFGKAVSCAGNVNACDEEGLCYDDLIISGEIYQGQDHVYVFFGSSEGLGSQPDWMTRFHVEGFGYSVGAAGDVNGDHFDDIIIGIPFHSYTNDGSYKKYVGAVWVFYGSAGGLPASHMDNGIPLADSADVSWQYAGSERDGALGRSVGTIGDVNGDGYSDILTAATGPGYGIKGRVLAFYGSENGLEEEPDWWGEDPVVPAYNNYVPMGVFGSTFKGYDVNNDGFGDLLIGAPIQTEVSYVDSLMYCGRVYLFMGSIDGLKPKTSEEPWYEWSIFGEGRAFLGASMDFVERAVDDDPFSDLMVGAPIAHTFGYTQTKPGKIHIFNRRFNHSPEIISQSAVHSVKAGELFRYDAEAADPDEIDQLLYSLGSNRPESMEIEPQTGVVTWTPGEEWEERETEFTIIVSDGDRSGSQIVPLKIEKGGNPAVILSHPPLWSTEWEKYSYQIEIEDPEGTEEFQYRLITAPAGMRIDPENNLLEWEYPQPGEHSVFFDIRDSDGYRTRQAYILLVLPNEAPLITSSPDTLVREGSTFTYQVKAVDPENNPDLRFRLDYYPEGMTIDSITGLIKWDIPGFFYEDFEMEVKVWVFDNVYLSDQQVFTLHILGQNDPPIIYSLPTVQVSEGQLYHYPLAVDNPDFEEPLFFTLLEGPDGLDMNPETGALKWIPGNWFNDIPIPKTGAYPVTISVHDTDSLFDYQSFVLEVSPTEAHILLRGNPGLIEVERGDTLRLPYQLDFLSSAADSMEITFFQSVFPEQGLEISPDTIASVKGAWCSQFEWWPTIIAHETGMYEIKSEAALPADSDTLVFSTLVKVYELPEGPELTEVYTFPLAIQSDQETEVVFTAQLIASDTLPESIVLEQKGDGGFQEVGVLRDDGVEPDPVADDGAFSGKLPLAPTTLDSLEFRASAQIPGTTDTLFSPSGYVSVTPFPSQIHLSDLSKTVFDSISGQNIISNRLLVSFAEGTSYERMEEILQNIEGIVVGIFYDMGLYQVEIPDSGRSEGVREAIEVLTGFVEIEEAEKVLVHNKVSNTEFRYPPKDSLFVEQWYLRGETKDAKGINAMGTWMATPGETGVFIMDSGIDPDHPDLQNALYGWVDVSKEPISEEKERIVDLDGHGTNMAGVIAAAMNNDIQDGVAEGMVGVAPNSKLVVVKFFDIPSIDCDENNTNCECKFDFTNENIYAALEWIKSYHYSDPSVNILVTATSLKPTDSTERYIEKLYQAGILLIDAAGNDNSPIADFPGIHKDVISVGGVDKSGNKHPGSNYGPDVELAAPYDVMVTNPTYPVISLCDNKINWENDYEWAGGTSFSASMVGGAAALVWDRVEGRRKRLNQDTSQTAIRKEVRDRLNKTAKPVPGNQLGSGRIDAFEAVFNGDFENPNLLQTEWENVSYFYDALAPVGTTPAYGCHSEGYVHLIENYKGLTPFSGKHMMCLKPTGNHPLHDETGFEQLFTVPEGVEKLKFSFYLRLAFENYSCNINDYTSFTQAVVKVGFYKFRDDSTPGRLIDQEGCSKFNDFFNLWGLLRLFTGQDATSIINHSGIYGRGEWEYFPVEKVVQIPGKTELISPWVKVEAVIDSKLSYYDFDFAGDWALRFAIYSPVFSNGTYYHGDNALLIDKIEIQPLPSEEVGPPVTIDILPTSDKYRHILELTEENEGLNFDYVIAETEAPDQMNWQIYDENDEIVYGEMVADPEMAGQIQWDGSDLNGEHIGTGNYRLEVKSFLESEPVGRSEKYEFFIVNVDADADADRDGTVENSDDDDEGEAVWMMGLGNKGAIFLVNSDDDDNDFLPDNWTGGEFNYDTDTPDHPDISINNDQDLADIGLLYVRGTGLSYFSDSAKMVLRVEKPVNEPGFFSEIPAEHRARIFLPTQLEFDGDHFNLTIKKGDTAVIGPEAGQSFEFVNKPEIEIGQGNISIFSGGGDIIFGLEGIVYGSLLNIYLEFWEGETKYFADTVQVKMAPFLLSSHRDPVLRISQEDIKTVFIVKTELIDNHRLTRKLESHFPSDLIDKTPFYSDDFDYNDIWHQDGYEIGYSKAPYGEMSVILGLPRGYANDEYMNRRTRRAMLGDGIGIIPDFQRPDPSDPQEPSGQDSGGNLECTTSVPEKFIFSTGMDSRVVDFLYAQGIQIPQALETTGYLHVGHVDELVSYCPDGQHTLYPDPATGWALMLIANKENPHAGMLEGIEPFGASGITVEEFLSHNSDFRTINLEFMLNPAHLPSAWQTLGKSNPIFDLSENINNHGTGSLLNAGALLGFFPNNEISHYKVVFLNSEEYQLLRPTTDRNWKPITLVSNKQMDLTDSLNSEPFAVPNFVGLPQEIATDSIQKIGMKVGAISMQNSQTVPPGFIMDQNPKADEHALPGDTLYLVVSTGVEWHVIGTGKITEDFISDDYTTYLFSHFWSEGNYVAGDEFYYSINPNVDWIDLPVLFRLEGNLGLALTSNNVNSLVDGTTIFTALPRGPKLDLGSQNNVDVFKHYICKNLQKAGFGNVIFADDLAYHNNFGSIHCATNVRRAIPAWNWWE